MQSAWKRVKKDEVPDGPARVVKPGDWGAVPDGSLKDFPLIAFNMPGRVAPKLDSNEKKLAEMAKEARKEDDLHKQALKKLQEEKEVAALAALAQGREEGQRLGEQQATEKYSQALEALQKSTREVLDSLAREKAALFLEFEGQALELVSSCIHRVFEAMAVGPTEAVLPLLKRAIQSIGEAATVTIKVNPDDFKLVQENRPFWLPINASLMDVKVVTDERISKGGCFVECDSTSVAAHAQEMADRIDEELKNVFLAKIQAKQAETNGGGPLP
jgi:flagellar biosynthesis/type III secretory pathway protein FliH